MKNSITLSCLTAVACVALITAPVYPGGQLTQVNGSGVLTGQHWDLSAALSNRSVGDGRTMIVYFAQGTPSSFIAAIQAAHDSWENIVAVDIDDVNNTLPHAPSNGAGGATPDGFNTHSFEFTLGCGGVLGITPTVINVSTGRIVEADTFYEGSNCVNWSTDGTPNPPQFELESVSVHELGHFIGLSHSGEVDSTMFPLINPGTTALSSLEPDDESSVTMVYGQDVADVQVPTGGISGRVIDGNNANDGKVCALVYAFSALEAPITNFNQAYVQVFSGSVVGATATSNTSGASSGFYEINGLPDGDWFVLVDRIGNLVQAGQISNWCAGNAEADVTQEWWNGAAESNAEGCVGCALSVAISGGQVTTGIDFVTETGTCSVTENPEASCADGVDNDCDGFADCVDTDCDSDPACTGGCMNDPECDDGVACTDDTCVAGVCQNTPNDANCPDDGQFCNGDEFCDAVADCSTTGHPCASSEWCSESGATCMMYGDGDFDGDTDVDLVDFGGFGVCFGQSAETNAACEPGNLVGVDGVIDLADYSLWVVAHEASGPQ